MSNVIAVELSEKLTRLEGSCSNITFCSDMNSKGNEKFELDVICKLFLDLYVNFELWEISKMKVTTDLYCNRC